MLMGDNPLLAPEGFGVGPDPWGAVQRAGWAALRRQAGDAHGRVVTPVPTSTRLP
jgi:hypothetical protein